MATVISSVPEAVTRQERLEEMHADTALSGLKKAIARRYITAQERRTLGQQCDSTFTELAVVRGLIVLSPTTVVPRTLLSKLVSWRMKATRASPRPRSTCVHQCGFQG